MVLVKSQHSSVIYITLLFAILLMLVPLPDTLRYARPEWVAITLIYWAMALPQRVSIGVAWFTGLVMDVVTGGILGIHAFAYALVIYLVGRLHLQIRQYPLWQQAFTILSLVSLVHFIVMLSAPITFSWNHWLTVLTSTLVWPFVYAVLRKIRRSFQVS
ncbi:MULTISPECIES: rod shape-determining protein MreD [unclassified Methylophaga]|jgi:rod shape-determining protein MreD|uniref:rod shape-determining protein MreD n=2 Tax=Methylophaga TaxID=40222 RepID=UPI000C382F00|nr:MULTISPECIES: rod shape-determining protein MreD [unclassified Methylophaga]MAL48671.1 rod shape-determining protein MreD [Methylophaga sp.]MAP26172.1 rod shape-determining protein MreD [Methylophaga sp.]MBP24561.1 rod shape-determining protein MreD [Methylophaga sp.]MDX1750365.1 rod shape-determining protein MreD [Methylophaga sp.]HAD32826.1 rod shape-determining protein MreD [Methylophaga sp.]|tara:strand:- start:711 stop:1187 length:477 start_codon:yes stop_codon:yes gene_type:complete